MQAHSGDWHPEKLKGHTSEYVADSWIQNGWLTKDYTLQKFATLPRKKM
jgi:hypothetical protein